jgi:DNA-binding CsgD family transcriptional regulator
MLLADSSLAAFLRMLADNPDPDTVSASIAQGVLSAFRPIVTAIGFIHLDRQVLAVVGTFGREPEIRHLYSAVPLDTDIPATVCYRTNAIVTTPSARLAVDYPLVAPYVNSGREPVHGEATAFPIRYRGAVIAVLGTEFDHPLPEPWFLRSAVSTISGPLAMWAALRMQLDDGPDNYWSRRPDRPLVVTERQQRIIALVRDGRTNSQIATEIGFSVPTIKSELARLSGLLGATSRAELATKAARAGF